MCNHNLLGQETGAILIVSENILALITAIHDVVDRARVFHTQLARPAAIFGVQILRVKPKN